MAEINLGKDIMVKISIWWVLLVVLIILVLVGCGFGTGYLYCQQTTEPMVREVEVVKWETVVKPTNCPPYTQFSDPIDFDEALLLLTDMRLSHVQALNWTFEGDPGFGIADREFQTQCISWYDQLIDYIWRLSR